MQDLGGGVIINIAALSGSEAAETEFAAYHASMGGLIELTRQAARELEVHRVRVNAIASRFIDEEARTDFGTPAMQGRKSHGQLKHRQKIVEAVLFLCGPEGTSFSGRVIEVENGQEGRGQPFFKL
jgi:NAD(P)-dependent dehydrogenase (short-subunit alcohol dehydrogenase family)